jgi:FtsZ-binding cell division protein ZapB
MKNNINHISESAIFASALNDPTLSAPPLDLSAPVSEINAPPHVLDAPVLSAQPLFTPVTYTTETPIRARITSLFLLLLITLLFLGGCRSKQTITEKTTINTDSTAIWSLNDSLYKKETQITNLQIDLQRLREENTRLLNETSTHQISYDTSAPVNPQTGKPPIASERFTVSKSILEQTKNEFETLLQTASLENESLSRQNRDLHLTVDKLTNENKQLTEKTKPQRLNYKLYLAGLISGIILLVLIYLVTKK